MNDKLCEITGYPREELLGMTFLDLTLTEEIAAGLEGRRAMLAGEISSFTTEKRYLRKNGETVWINLVSNLERTATGEPKYIISVSEDITPRKLAEFRLRRLNRLHTVLSKIGEAIVRTGDRQELYAAACRIVAEDGLLRLAFVVEVDPATKVARPVAFCGEERGYLSDLKISLDGGALSRGTVGTALRTGAHNVCNDIANDPRMAPWRERAQEHGFRATAAFPLRLDEKTIGALALYAAEAGYFQDDEIRLMVSVANDISFALETLKKEELRQHAEIALRKSEEQFRNMFNAAATGIAISTPHGRFLQANAAYCQMLGYTEDELRTRDFASLTHPDDLEANLELRDEMLAGKRDSFVMEKRYFKKGGDIVWTRHSVSAAHTVEGKIGAMVVVAEDITERKRAEGALRQSEQRLRLITNLVPHCIFAKDAAGRFIFANRALALAYGTSVEEILGKTDFDFVADKAQAEAYQAADRAVIESGKEMFIAEEPRTDFTGRTALLQTTKIPFTVAETGEPAVLGVWMDITERKRMESRFRRLVDSNVQGVIFWNTKGEIMGGNDAFLKMVRYTRQDLEAGLINWAEMTPPEYVDRDRRALQELAEKGICATYEKEWIRKDGSRVPILLGSAIFEDNPEEGVCFVLDLTDRKKIEQQFLRAQRMESIGTLAGGVAHDLNNSLGPIIMSLDLFKARFPDPESQSLIDIIQTSAQRGADMVRQVLSFARGVEGQRMVVQVQHLIRDIQKIANDTFLKNFSVRTNIAPDVWLIAGDPTQLHQVLLNLCVNARDAMPNGGAITISAENIHLDEHSAGMNVDAQPGPYVVLCVEDTGTGMPPEVIERIFDPFYTTKEQGKGTGLGLATSLAIVKSHGGFIHVYSEPEKGSKFRVYIPAQTETALEAETSLKIEMPRGNGELILVVDDESSVRQITQQTLEAFGYRVVLASDGAEAVAVYASRGAEVAAVVTDMMMPGIDGPATIQVLRKMKANLPVIAASGLSTDAQVGKARDLGVKHFLPKPFTAEALLKMLKQVLAKES